MGRDPLGNCSSAQALQTRKPSVAGALRQGMFASRLRVRMARPNAADSRHITQSSSHVWSNGPIESGRLLTQVPKSADTLHPRWCANTRPSQKPVQTAPWHTLPKASSLATFETPMAGSSSLSIVSSPIFGSIGTGGKNTTMRGSRPRRGLTHSRGDWYRGTRRPRRRGRMSL